MIVVAMSASGALSAQESPSEPGPQKAVSAQPAAASPWWSLENLGLGNSTGGGPMFRLGTWEGSLETSYEKQRQRTQAADTPDQVFARRRASERLNIRNGGFSVIDPRLLTGNLGLTYELVRDHQESNGVGASRTGSLTGYNFDSTFLGEKPYSATVYANRNKTFYTQPFGGSTDLALQNRGVVLRLREDSILRERGILPYFRASLRASQEQLNETTTVPGQVFRRDESRNLLNFEGHNGFETADLDLRYESIDYENRVYLPGAYKSQATNLDYSRDFGPNLSRRWDSRVYYIDRTGGTPLKFLNVDEQVSIDHHENLSTFYQLRVMQQDTAGGATDTYSPSFRLRHRLYGNLVTNLQLADSHQRLSDGTRDNYNGQLDFDYRRGLPNGQVSAQLGGRYEVEDDQLRSSQIQVVEEPHAAPSPLGAGAGFMLNNGFVIESSIVIVDTRGGARLPATLGIDYTVVTTGNLTQIVPQPTSAVILPGDPLIVSYSYQVDPSLKYSSTSAWLGAGMDLRWIAASFSHEQTAQTALSGSSSTFLENRRKDRIETELRGQWNALQARAGAAFVRYNATRLAYTEQRFVQRVTYRPGYDVTLTLSAEEFRTDYTLPVRQSDGRSGRIDLDWFAQDGWWTTAYVSKRILNDSMVPADSISEASLRIRRNWRKLEFNSVLALVDRTRGTVDTTDRRFMLTAIRRF